jgi:hypothetical protein
MRLYILLFIILPFFGFAQDDISNPDKLKEKVFELGAEFIAPQTIKLPFSSIKIIDSRFDTSKLGFIYTGSFFRAKAKSYKKFKLKNGIESAIEKYYNEYYANSFMKNGFELLIVMKKFWISQFEAGNTKRQDIAKDNSTGGSFLCKWEYYIGNNGNYLPVKRVDTAFNYSEEIAKYIEKEFEEKKLMNLKFFLKKLIEIYDFEKALTVFDKQPKKTIEQINLYNQKRFNIPIIHDSITVNGVYLSFSDFQENKPSITLFTEKKMKYGNFKKEEFIQDEKGNTINPYWGYSNNSEIKYGLYGHDKIYRVSNTFEFFTRVTWHSTSTTSGDIPITYNTKNEVWIPIQIDMETGEIY